MTTAIAAAVFPGLVFCGALIYISDVHLDSLFDGDIDIERLAEVLDGIGHAGRVETIRRWDARVQSRLYEAVKGFRSLTLDHFVPPETASLVEVIHHGKNSLPTFTLFEKRFCKPELEEGEEDGEAQLWGYNEGHVESLIETKVFTGPGYFVTHAPRDRVEISEGEIDIDYRMLPKGKVASWPPVAPNEDRLGRFVYAGMVDVMRGISNHVSIGRAIKGGRYIDAWFVLCREDRKTAA